MPNSLHLKDSCISSEWLFWISRDGSAKLKDDAGGIVHEFSVVLLLIHLDWGTDAKIIDARMYRFTCLFIIRASGAYPTTVYIMARINSASNEIS